MATEETDGEEFHEKTGLKRKLTGPPRLLLGKPLSPVRDEIKSDAHVWRKQQRHKFSEAVKDTGAEHQGNSKAGCESQCAACLNPQSNEGAVSPDLQEQSLEVISKVEQSRVKRHQGKRRAKVTFRRLFSPAFPCVMRRKKSTIKYEKDLTDDTVHSACVNLQDGNTGQEPQTTSSVPSSITERCQKEVVKQASAGKVKKTLRVRVWPFFKRLSVTSERNLSREEGCTRPCIDTFIEIASRKSAEGEISPNADTADCCASESSGALAADEQLKGSSEIHEGRARIPEETCRGNDPDRREEGTEMMKESGASTAFIQEKMEQECCTREDVCKHQHLPHIMNEEVTNVRVTEMLEPVGLVRSEVPILSVNECSPDAEVTEMSLHVPVTHAIALSDTHAIVPIENEAKCKPVITIGEVHSSDEENQDAVENNPPQCGRLSALVSPNGSCYSLKINNMTKDTLQSLDQSEHKSLLSEIVLMQTALSLVRGAISKAVEQLSAELQSTQTDQHYA